MTKTHLRRTSGTSWASAEQWDVLIHEARISTKLSFEVPDWTRVNVFLLAMVLDLGRLRMADCIELDDIRSNMRKGFLRFLAWDMWIKEYCMRLG